MLDCQKMTVKNENRLKEFFWGFFDHLGKTDTVNSNFAQILTFGQCLPEIRALKVVK